jgi:Ca-activated chloride channel family protein
MDLRFADPYILLLLITALPALALFMLFARTDRAAIQVGAVALTANLQPPTSWRARADPWLPAVRILAVALLIIALARPQRGEAVTGSGGEGIDIVLAYDISASMTEIFTGRTSRLDAAETVLKRFVQGRGGDRVGLVVFRGNALALSPLTTDYAALTDAIELAPTLRLDDGTAIGTAMGESLNIIRSSESTTRIVILLTDGKNNGGTIEPLAAARIAEQLGIRVYTIGVVSAGLGGSTSTINVDEAALREIANVTGGAYNRAQDPAALQQVYDDIDRLEESRFQAVDITRYNELAPLLLAAAALTLALELLLRHTFLRRPA